MQQYSPPLLKECKSSSGSCQPEGRNGDGLLIFAVAEQAAVRGRMTLRQGVSHTRAMTGGALFFGLLAGKIKKGGMFCILRERRGGHRRGLPEKEKNTAADQDKNKIDQPDSFSLRSFFSHVRNPKQ